MTNEEMEQLKADHDYWTAKHKALAESVELLAGSAHDLRAAVEAQVARERLREERSSRYLDMLAGVLKAWAEDQRRNGEEK
jgi:hypothetical protein